MSAGELFADEIAADIYERLPREPAGAYGCFVAFCELVPPRKVKKLAEKVNLSPQYLYRLASKWQWSARAAAYDRNEEAAVHFEVRAHRVQLARKQLAVAAGMLSWSARYLTGMTQDKLDNMSPTEVARWSKTAVELARAALGEADARVAIGTQDRDGSFRPLAGMGDADQRAELGACLAELGERIRNGEMVQDEDSLLALLAGPVSP